MSILQHGMVGAGGVDVGDIGHSLRFRSAASAYLSRTLTTDATSTYFFAVRRGKLGVITPIFGSSIKFNANDTLTAFGLTTTAVFRDPSAFVYVHVSNGGLYVNGISLGAITTSALVNASIGYDGTNYADMYIARIGCVSGISSAYTNFGYLNTEINEWVSKSQSAVKAVVDAGGTNSFMLDFDNGTSTTTLGYDKSTKGNNWTCNNISLTAGTTYDWMVDVPGNSYATLNPLLNFPASGTYTLSNGNLTCSDTSSTYGHIRATQAFTVGTGFNLYAEVTCTSSGGDYGCIGVIGINSASNNYVGGQSDGYSYQTDGQKINNSSRVAYGSSYTTGDVIGIAVNATSGALTFYKNNVSQGVAYTLPVGAYTIAVGDGQNSTLYTWNANFGQRPFAYTPPTGFEALCQANLSASGTVTISGTFTGNASAGGPFVWINGVPTTLTINGNAVTFGTHADKTAGGFKLRTSSSSYNASGSNSWTATIVSDTKNLFKYNNAQGNP